MPKCDRTPGWVFSCRFTAYFQNNFSSEYLWVAASVRLTMLLLNQGCLIFLIKHNARMISL